MVIFKEEVIPCCNKKDKTRHVNYQFKQFNETVICFKFSNIYFSSELLIEIFFPNK